MYLCTRYLNNISSVGNFFSMSTKTVVSKVVYEVFAGIIGWFAAKVMDWLFDLIPKDMELTFWQWLIYPQFSALNILIFIVVVGFLSWLIWRKKNAEKRIIRKLSKNTSMQIPDLPAKAVWKIAAPNMYNASYHCYDLHVECMTHGTTLSDLGFCPNPECIFCRTPFNINYLRNLINTKIFNESQRYMKSN